MAFPAKVTDEQVIAALIKHDGIVRRAAKTLGVNPTAIRQRLPRLKLKGYSPEHGYVHPVPDGFNVKGVSQLRNAAGEVVLQWVKSQQDADRARELHEVALVAMGERVPRAKPAAAPAATNAELLALYVVTDYHLGMLSWPEETGDDWNTDLAEQQLVAWFAQAIAAAPCAERAVFAQLGDFLHFDGMEALTPASRHLLDADTRFQKIVRVAIRALRQVIGMLLAKHRHVHLVMAEGNHDPASSIWLRELFRALYEDEPRISVDLSPDPYYCVEHGDTSLFFHHGHKRKPTDVSDVFAAKFREVFGRTKHSYAHMGHMHHIEVKENSLMVVEQHRTLAAKDAYASRGGWISGRDAQVVWYHRRHGEVGRARVSAQMLEAA